MGSGRIPDKSTVASPERFSIQYNDIDGSKDIIGRGGQAVVYEIQLGSGYPLEKVALKEPLAPDTLTKDIVNSFLNEAETWATVDRRERTKSRWSDSEHVVGIIDTGDKLPWIAMEYMDGGSLESRLKAEDGGFSQAEALWIAECICHGIEVAHSYGIAHLDLKPANILFRKTNANAWDVPKIADWGVARVLSDETKTVENFSVFYAAPEQFVPEEFGEPDTLTDVYQLGAILYTLLTGDPPYTGPQLSVMHDVTTDELPPPPSERRPELSEKVDETVLTALETKKVRRYDSVHGFKRAIQAVRRNKRLPQIVDQRVTNKSNNSKEKDQIINKTKKGEQSEIDQGTGKPSRAISSTQKQVRGVVDFVNETGGYGFIETDAHQEDVFFHMDDIGGPILNEGQEVKLIIEEEEKGPRATNLTRLGEKNKKESNSQPSQDSLFDRSRKKLKQTFKTGSSHNSLIDRSGDPTPGTALVEYLDYDIVTNQGWNPYDPTIFSKAADMSLLEQYHGVLEVEKGEYILDSAEAAGFDWPFSCRAGACANCAAILVDGEVEMDMQQILSDNEVETKNYVLSCVATPKTDTVKIIYGAKEEEQLQNRVI